MVTHAVVNNASAHHTNGSGYALTHMNTTARGCFRLMNPIHANCMPQQYIAKPPGPPDVLHGASHLVTMPLS